MFRELSDSNKYLQMANHQLYSEMRKFQDEISSGRQTNIFFNNMNNFR